MTTEFISALSQLKDQAETSRQPFLAHVIGLAILEANKVMTEAARSDGSRSDGFRG
jgi:hypothetical protein